MREKKALTTAVPAPFGLLRQMTSELDRMFDDPSTIRWPALRTDQDTMWSPKVDVFEKDNRLITRVDLPGVKKEDMSVEVADGQLQLSGVRTSETEEQHDNVYRCECEYGQFFRTVPLPQGVTPDDVKATFANGVLEVSMPLPDKTNGRKVPIQEAPPAKTAA